MLQHGPSRTELRLMDSYIQILCSFQKSKQKVPPPSQTCAKKLVQGSGGGGTFRLHFWNLHKIWM